MTIKTFRGLIADGGQDTIVLHTIDGSTGYRIVKFQVMGQAPGVAALEHIVKIYKIEQATPVTGTIDFSDNTLLAAAYIQDNIGEHYVSSVEVIFDNEIFNQDIYVTVYDAKTGTGEGTVPINYYIELEQIKLDLNENTVATLKDIRNTTAPVTS